MSVSFLYVYVWSFSLGTLRPDIGFRTYTLVSKIILCLCTYTISVSNVRRRMQTDDSRIFVTVGSLLLVEVVGVEPQILGKR